MRHLLVSAVTGAAGLSLAALSLAAATPASAAPCSGFTCAGHDPATTGCDQYPSTYKQSGGSLATITNWYSEGCNANWAQASLTPAAYAAGDKLTMIIRTTDSKKNLEDMCYPGPGNTGQLYECGSSAFYRGTAPAYTDMVDGTNKAYAVVDVYDSTSHFLGSYEADQ